MILDLAWRQGSPDSNRCQLVTWSKDLALRLWEMGLELQGLFGIRNNFYSYKSGFYPRFWIQP
jgi:hypothetical protein